MVNGTVNIFHDDQNMTFQHILQPEPFDAKTDDSHMVVFDTNSIVDCNRETQPSFSPMIVTQPFVVASTTLSIRLFVPLAKLSHSNTPTGPFHTICLALATAAAFALELSGPQSKPCREESSPWQRVPHRNDERRPKCFLTIQPAGIPAETVAVPVVAFSSNLSAVTKSTGSVILTLFFSALAIRSLTMPAPSSSNREVPIWWQKVKRRLFDL